jgi:hypothetical protein
MKALQKIKRSALWLGDLARRYKRWLRMFERLVLWSGAVLGIVAICGLLVVVGRPAEMGGSQSCFAGA